MKNIFIFCIFALLLTGCSKKAPVMVYVPEEIQMLEDGATVIAEEQEIFPLPIQNVTSSTEEPEEALSLELLDIDEIELIPAFQLDMHLHQ